VKKIWLKYASSTGKWGSRSALDYVITDQKFESQNVVEVHDRQRLQKTRHLARK